MESARYRFELTFFRSAPLLPIAIALTLGMATGLWLPLNWKVVLPLITLSLFLARRNDLWLLAGVMLLGGWRMDPYPYHRLASDIDTGVPRAITAVVEERRLRPFPAVDFVLSVQGGLPDSLGIHSILWRTGHYASTDSLQRLPYLPGDTITVIGRIRWPRGQRNPHGFNELAYLWSRGIDARVVGLAQVPHWRPYTGLSLNRTVDAIRSRISGQLEEWMGDQSPLASALILGDRGNLDAAFVARTRAIGVAHILAVSGLHVGFVAALLVALLGPWPISRLLKAGWAVLLLVGYLSLTGSPPSVMRAVIMVSLYLLGRASDRSVSTWNILSAAAIISLLIHPRSLLTPGFQLSFTAVAGIVAFHPYLKEALASTRWGSAMVARPAGRYIAGLMIMTIGAQLGSLPVTLAWFHQLPLMGVAANLIIVPLAGFGITALFIALLWSVISPLIAGIFGSAAWALFTAMTRAIDLLARGPVPLLVTGAISWGGAIIITVGVIFLPWLIWGRWRTRQFRLAAAILLAINLNLWPIVLAEKRLSVTILDVGQGDAIHIATPDGTHILVDAGPRYEEWDAGQMIVLPYLLGQGVTHLDLVAVTHAHADHAGGLLSLLEHLEVAEVRHPLMGSIPPFYRKMEVYAESHQIPLHPWTAGDIFVAGDVTLQVLAPDSLLGTSPLGHNEGSLVLKLIYGDTSMLLTGDTEGVGEARLAAYGPHLQSDWLKVAHHGGATSSSGKFIAQVGAVGAVISVGRYNNYRHPSEKTVERLTSTGATVLRTDKSGAVMLESDGKSWFVKEMGSDWTHATGSTVLRTEKLAR